MMLELRYSKQQYDLAQCSQLEWLETNGIGGYASSTLLNCHTRKYHGLMVSKLAALADKYVLLSKLDDSLVVNDQEYPLSVHQYADCLLSDAFSSFQEFICDTHPQIIYKIASAVHLTKEILLLNGEDTVLIKYKVVNGQNAKLRMRPLLAYRNFHSLAKENSSFNAALTRVNSGDEAIYKITPYCGMPGFFIALAEHHRHAPFISPPSTVTADPVWYRSFAYCKEKERGYPFSEDLLSPCVMEFSLAAHSEVIVACSLRNLAVPELPAGLSAESLDVPAVGSHHVASLFELWDSELKRRKEIESKLHGSAMQKQLQKVGRTFLSHSSNGAAQSTERCTNYGVIAGYHWFLEWGRDAMISLPGLTLCHASKELEQECLAVLRSFAGHEKAGLIPNFIGSTEESSAYNSVDASLWFAWAVQQYYAVTKDGEGVKNYLWGTLINIFKHYKNGTIYDIKMQDDGLLYAGNKEINLTWMDAVIGGVPVTPRYGLAVEVNALWFNLLSFMHDLAENLIMDDSIKDEIAQLLPKIRLNFCQTFYNEGVGYLYDFINEEEKNDCLRPNQIFAVSLPYSPLPKKIAQKIVQKVSSELLTPYGLRTLSPQDTNYRGIYFGTQKERDMAYHNGTVWPWLLGHFGEALLKLNDREHALKLLQPCLVALREHVLHDGGIGTISEVFSGDALPLRPLLAELQDGASSEAASVVGSAHRADGCISQAWSVAETLRLTYLLSRTEMGQIQ